MNHIETYPIINKDSPIDFLWEHKGLMVVAAGPGPCVRGLYARACALHKLHQFMYCNTSADDYILGNAEDKMCATVLQAACIKGVQIIILYLNCLDILIRIDFANLEKKLSQETGLPVRCFFRGPLAKKDPRWYVPPEEFVKNLPEETSQIDPTLVHQLPPLATDLAGDSDLLRFDGAMNVLVAPKGCRICLRDYDLTESQQHQYILETLEKDYVFGFEDTCLEQVVNAAKEKSYTDVNLISSAIPAFIGFDGDWVMSALKESNIYGCQIPADGFSDAIYGISCASELLVKLESRLYGEKQKEILIVGYSPLLCGGKEQYQACLDYIASLGYTFRFLGEKRGGRPALCWVISAAGLAAAQTLYEKWDVPVLISCPVGEHATQMWKKNVKELCEGNKEIRKLCIHNHNIPKTDERKILFIGDPIHTMALAHECWHRGVHQVKLAAFARYPNTVTLFRKAPGADKFLTVVSDIEEMRKLWAEADVVVADPQLQHGMPEKVFVPFPWGCVSGRYAVADGSGVLGQNIVCELDKLFK